MRGFVGRLGDAARATTEGQMGRTDPFGFQRRGPTGRPGDDGRRRHVPRSPSMPTRCRTSRPSSSAAWRSSPCSPRVGTAGALSGSWETILLWQNRVPFAAAGATAVVDPVFGRDVSYYLFELPFLRLVQAIVGRAPRRGARRRRRALPRWQRRAAAASRRRSASTSACSAASTC